MSDVLGIAAVLVIIAVIWLSMRRKDKSSDSGTGDSGAADGYGGHDGGGNGGGGD